MDAGTLAAIGTTITTFLALITYIRVEVRDLRGEMKDVRGEVRDVRGDVRDVRSDIRRLDDRVFALASGGRPLVEQTDRTD